MGFENALVVVLLSLLVTLAWTVWYTVGHVMRANRAQAGLLEDAMTHLWSLRAAETPERAALAAQLENTVEMRRERMAAAPALAHAESDPWFDDANMARS